MRKESNYNGQDTENLTAGNVSESLNEAFQYLRSLPKNHDRYALEGYKRKKGSQIIDEEVAGDFTTSFRSTATPFYIPVSWMMTKTALVNLLGITDYDGCEEVNGVRFYAGVNEDNQLTLIAVSTMDVDGDSDDLTIDDEYPYYDYADPCPNSCSRRGNLKVQNAVPLKVVVTE